VHNFLRSVTVKILRLLLELHPLFFASFKKMEQFSWWLFRSKRYIIDASDVVPIGKNILNDFCIKVTIFSLRRLESSSVFTILLEIPA
jgi:hypothetical protein